MRRIWRRSGDGGSGGLWWDGVGVDGVLADPGGDGVGILVVDDVRDFAEEDVHEEGVRVGAAEDVEVVVEVGGEGREGHCWIVCWVWSYTCGWRWGCRVGSGVVESVVDGIVT